MPYEPDGILGQPFEYTYTVAGLEPPYVWQLLSKDLPRGVVFTSDAQSATIKGIPQQTGFYNIELQVSDKLGNTEKRQFPVLFSREYGISADIGQEITMYQEQEVSFNNSRGLKLRLVGSEVNEKDPNLSTRIRAYNFTLIGFRGDQLFTENFTLSIGQKKEIDNYVIELLRHDPIEFSVTLKLVRK